jgi:hypothetical protein
MPPMVAARDIWTGRPFTVAHHPGYAISDTTARSRAVALSGSAGHRHRTTRRRDRSHVRCRRRTVARLSGSLGTRAVPVRGFVQLEPPHSVLRDQRQRPLGSSDQIADVQEIVHRRILRLVTGDEIEVRSIHGRTVSQLVLKLMGVGIVLRKRGVRIPALQPARNLLGRPLQAEAAAACPASPRSVTTRRVPP